MKRKSNSLSAIILSGCLSTILTSIAPAADASWIGGTLSTGNYTVTGNWSTSAFPGISGATGGAGASMDIATFTNNTSAPVSYTATAGADVNLGGILFSGTPGPITFVSGSDGGSGTRRIYFTAGGAGITMNAGVTSPMTFARTGISSGASGSVTYTNNATDTAAILNMSSTFLNLAAGASSLVLGGTNTGLNRIGNNISSNAGAGALTVVKNGSGTWVLDGSGSTYTGTTILNEGALGAGTSTAFSSGEIVINGGSLGTAGLAARVLANNVRIGGNFSLGGIAALPITLNGTVDLGGTGRTVNLINSATIAGVISNGGLTLTAVAGTRTLALNATNTFTGATVVSSGTLLVNGTLPNSSSVSVASGATLGGDGGITNPVTVSQGGFLQPGLTTGVVGSLDTGMLTMGGSYIPTITGNGVNDVVNITGSANFGGGTVAPVLSSYVPSLNDVFDIANWSGSFSGAPTFDFSNAALSPGLSWDSSDFASSGSLRVVAVPEPAAAALTALGLLSLFRRRRCTC